MKMGSLFQLPVHRDERKAWQLELVAAAHVASTETRQRVVKSGVQLTHCFVFSSGPMEWGHWRLSSTYVQ